MTTNPGFADQAGKRTMFRIAGSVLRIGAYA